MTKTHNNSIQKLDDELIELYNNIKSLNKEFKYVYGSNSDTLVVVSNNKGSSTEFREFISEKILNTLDKPCGFVLSDGPSEYNEYTTAYIRKNPDNAYEYILAPLMKLVDEKEITTIFHQVNALSNEYDEDNPRIMASTYLYILLQPDISIDDISSLMGVKQDDIRNNALDAQEKIEHVLYE